MSFQSYIDNIEKQTGLTPDDFFAAARQKGMLEPGVTATQITDRLKADYGLGYGHASAIYKLTKDRMDVGIKLKGEPAKGRFAAAGKWNEMVTHRVRVTDPKQVDAELIGWLKKAYAAA